jgi:hypothetical protein
MALQGPFPVEFGTVFPSVLSGSPYCRAMWRLSTLEEVLQQVSRGVVLVIVADQEPGQRGTGLMCNTCRGSGG